jgi:hypothetical protein
MRQFTCSTGTSMELCLLVISRTWVCLCQPETLSWVYLMICAPYEMGILFYRELHGTGSLSKLSYLGPFCTSWKAFFSVLNDLCTVRDGYSVLQRTACNWLTIKFSYMNFSSSTWSRSSVYIMICAPYEKVSCSTGNCMELGPLVNSGPLIYLVQPDSCSLVYLLICAQYETGILIYREMHGTGSLNKLSYLGLSCATWNAFASVLNDLCTVWDRYPVLLGTAWNWVS